MSDKLRYDLAPLNKMVNSLNSGYVVRVGIFGDKTNRQGNKETNAEIGALHEYGGTNEHGTKIPMRSFLRMPLFQMSESVLKQTAVGMMELLKKGDMKSVLRNLGIACEVVIKKAFESHGFGSWAPNRPSTIKRKGSDSPLIDTSQLRRAITSKVEKLAS